VAYPAIGFTTQANDQQSMDKNELAPRRYFHLIIVRPFAFTRYRLYLGQILYTITPFVLTYTAPRD
jgi:hypothetical protein